MAEKTSTGNDQSSDSTQPRRRRRGGRRRRSPSQPDAASPPDGSAPSDADAQNEIAESDESDQISESTFDEPSDLGDETSDSDEEAEDSDEATAEEKAIASGGTRMAAKKRSSRGRSRGELRRQADAAEEARRVLKDGAPRSMLVTRHQDRTHVAILEERTVVEHYVTKDDNVSYVGNIYLGRVQNVLPGMEAAFVDIGKGRNGVLYAGEVLYDEADLESGDPPRIEDQLKTGARIPVQVTKDPMGSKGARLTQRLSLPGRYMVLTPHDPLFGVSKKIPDDERDRLRKIIKARKPDDHGLIVRTAAWDVSEDNLVQDIDRLVERWDAVQAKIEEVEPLEAVYEEPRLIVRTIRDHFGQEFEKLIVDDADLFDQAHSYLEEIAPDQLEKLQRYAPETEDDEPTRSLFDAYEVNDQIRKALDRKVTLPSGGYLIIDRTEAMTVIDVNTGRFTGQDGSSLEETVLKTNLEAAEGIVQQLRLRDIGGIIVIDFIDMLLKVNQDQVVRCLKRELLRDRTKSRVSEVSKLGLVQMTRKNVSQGLAEAFSDKCDTCNGHGYVTNFG